MRNGLARHGLAWLLITVVPAAVNLLIWEIGVVPAQKKLAAVREMTALVEIKPRLEALVSQSDQILSKQSQGSPITGDIASVVQWIQGSAKAQGIQIEEINKNNPEDPAAARIPVEFKVTGGYFRLTHWLTALEKNPDIRMDHCSLGPASAPGANNRMDLTVQILSRNP